MNKKKQIRFLLGLAAFGMFMVDAPLFAGNSGLSQQLKFFFIVIGICIVVSFLAFVILPKLLKMKIPWPKFKKKRKYGRKTLMPRTEQKEYPSAEGFSGSLKASDDKEARLSQRGWPPFRGVPGPGDRDNIEARLIHFEHEFSMLKSQTSQMKDGLDKLNATYQKMNIVHEYILKILKTDYERFLGIKGKVDQIEKELAPYKGLFADIIFPRESRDQDLTGELEGLIGKASFPQPSPIKKELNEENLIGWWNKYGSRGWQECEIELKKTFGPGIEVKIFLPDKGGDEWKVLRVSKAMGAECYLLPLKADIWWDNYYQGTSRYKEWFELEDVDRGGPLARINRIKSLPRVIYSGGRWLLKEERKGLLSVMES